MVTFAVGVTLVLLVPQSVGVGVDVPWALKVGERVSLPLTVPLTVGVEVADKRMLPPLFVTAGETNDGETIEGSEGAESVPLVVALAFEPSVEVVDGINVFVGATLKDDMMLPVPLTVADGVGLGVTDAEPLPDGMFDTELHALELALGVTLAVGNGVGEDVDNGVKGRVTLLLRLADCEMDTLAPCMSDAVGDADTIDEGVGDGVIVDEGVATSLSVPLGVNTADGVPLALGVGDPLLVIDPVPLLVSLALAPSDGVGPACVALVVRVSDEDTVCVGVWVEESEGGSDPMTGDAVEGGSDPLHV